ncbi:ParB N-terminal domain-containing protein [Natronococcus sp. A-GB1]|uniref:ParB N-terminal domain-containing protein n=1 Tax=Natronococcus sp. A-GB1 TaxID=3037648 RepID=UPI00241C852F|nr:ParB N-terminal domain-containing protein [Natronococcus sp. A-GB1]MDG5761547.1 ParB N-terminal domain-containing protein [Natronococcus sp. A-GB1]
MGDIVSRLKAFVISWNLHTILPLGYYYLLLYKIKSILWPNRVINPYRVISINPSNIEKRENKRIHKWRNMGEIKSGDWDKKCGSIWDSEGLTSTYMRYDNGMPWEETEVYKSTLSAVSNGETYWQCRTVSDLQKRTEKLDQIYNEIKKNGVKSQKDIHNKSVDQMLRSISFLPSQTDIAVAISRNGEPILIDGHHRLAMAKALNLKKIPVRIVVYHRDYL